MSAGPGHRTGLGSLDMLQEIGWKPLGGCEIELK